jgi:putative oxidoreductase
LTDRVEKPETAAPAGTSASDWASLLLRLVFGGYMLAHGWPKVVRILEGNFTWVDPLGIGEGASLVGTMVGEFVCPAFVVAGVFTRWACVPVVFTMVVGLVLQHGADPWIVWHDPLQHSGGGLSKEQPILYAAAFLAILVLGPGRFSLDAVLRFRFRRRANAAAA